METITVDLASYQNETERIGAMIRRIKELEEALELIRDGGKTGRSQSPALNMPSEDWLRYRISDLERIASAALRGPAGDGCHP